MKHQSSVNRLLKLITGKKSDPLADKVKSVLILYEERIQFIGDCCVRFDKLEYFQQFYKNATIDVNFKHTENDKFVTALLFNNPNLNSIGNSKWESIDLPKYDLIFLIAHDEGIFLDFVAKTYGAEILSRKVKFCVSSLSLLILRPEAITRLVFPVNMELVNYLSLPHIGKIYVSQKEEKWVSRWLKSKGVKENDQLFIFIDSTSDTTKLITPTVLLDVMKQILTIEVAKILIFDESHGIKQTYYSNHLDKKQISKCIFSNKKSLRKNISLMTSPNTKMILGPCTGLMHCASGAYNYYFHSGTRKDLPLLITYTGKYTGPNNCAYTWWGNAPLVKCVMLRSSTKKKITLLQDLPDNEKTTTDTLPCSEYSSKLLLRFITENLASPSYPLV